MGWPHPSKADVAQGVNLRPSARCLFLSRTEGNEPHLPPGKAKCGLTCELFHSLFWLFERGSLLAVGSLWMCATDTAAKSTSLWSRDVS